jgi:hypothetical protein
MLQQADDTDAYPSEAAAATGQIDVPADPASPGATTR